MVIVTVLIILIPELPSQTTNNKNATPYNYKKPEPAGTPNYFLLLIKTLFFLGLFIIVIYIAVKYLARKQGVKFPLQNVIKLISTLPVGTNRFIHLIEIGTHYFLIGSTDSSINLIAEITDRETIEAIRLQKGKSKIQKTGKYSFFDFLKEMFGGIKRKPSQVIDFNFIKIQKERLKNLNNEK